MTSYRLSVAALALSAGTAAAQFSITPGGANAGNGVFGNGANVTSATGVGIADGIFRPGATASTDSLYAHTWYFRGNSDTREYTFANTTTAPFNMSGVVIGNNANTLDTGGYDFTVANATSGYNFTAQLRYTIVAGAAGPTVNYSCTITNTNAAPLTLALFDYCDIDCNGTAAGDTYVINGAGNAFQVSDGPTLTEFRATSPNAYQATIFANLRGLLSNTTVENLNGTVVGSPGDFTGAFQWNLQIAPNASATVGGSMAFVSSFTTGCYANCDSSTAQPILNANDFQCFLNAFAAGDSYANCDNSSANPVLNANDFQCFLNTFAAGCS